MPIAQMKKLVLFTVDECSFSDAQTFGNMHKNAQTCIHKGKNHNKSWGFQLFSFWGIIISFLPSIQHGIFEFMDEALKTKILNHTKSEVQHQCMLKGWQEFHNMTEHVHRLTTSHQISESNTELHGLMTNICAENDQDITDEQAQHLLNL